MQKFGGKNLTSSTD